MSMPLLTKLEKSFKESYSINLPNPSPMPSRTRRNMSIYMDAPKNGVTNVAIDHMRTARVNIFLLLCFLAALPPITYIRETHTQQSYNYWTRKQVDKIRSVFFTILTVN